MSSHSHLASKLYYLFSAIFSVSVSGVVTFFEYINPLLKGFSYLTAIIVASIAIFKFIRKEIKKDGSKD